MIATDFDRCGCSSVDVVTGGSFRQDPARTAMEKRMLRRMITVPSAYDVLNHPGTVAAFPTIRREHSQNFDDRARVFIACVWHSHCGK